MGSSFVAVWPDTEIQDIDVSATGREGDMGHSQQKQNNFLQNVSRKAAQCALEARRDIEKILGSSAKVNFGLCHGQF